MEEKRIAMQNREYHKYPFEKQRGMAASEGFGERGIFCTKKFPLRKSMGWYSAQSAVLSVSSNIAEGLPGKAARIRAFIIWLIVH